MWIEMGLRGAVRLPSNLKSKKFPIIGGGKLKA